ncbi:hypothetical protein J6590_089795 [Homalodisca vitripennis]|nr:hypothetical protein J6590_089795 [Homalodisca vitripennis]
MVAKSENAKKRLFKMMKSQTKEKNKVKKQKSVPKNKMKVESESEEENDALCLICLEPFSESKPGQGSGLDTVHFLQKMGPYRMWERL